MTRRKAHGEKNSGSHVATRALLARSNYTSTQQEERASGGRGGGTVYALLLLGRALDRYTPVTVQNSVSPYHLREFSAFSLRPEGRGKAPDK